MNLPFEHQLAADLAALVNAQRIGGQAVFADRDQCERVRGALERILVSADDIRTYDRLLSRICGNQFHYLDELPEEIVERIVEQGIVQLEPEWLARLVLDPVWVRMLSDEITKRFPEAWWDAMHRDGKRILAQQGLSEFPFPPERFGALRGGESDGGTIIVLRRADRMTDPANEFSLQAAASPSCKAEDDPGEVQLSSANGFEVWASKHPEPGWTTLRFVGRQLARPVVLSIKGREVPQVEPLDDNGYVVVATADIVAALTGPADLHIEHRRERP